MMYIYLVQCAGCHDDGVPGLHERLSKDDIISQGAREDPWLLSSIGHSPTHLHTSACWQQFSQEALQEGGLGQEVYRLW